MAENERMPLRTDQAAIPTILVDINDLKFREFLVEMLKMKFDCEILFVTQGRSVLETVKSVKPDLLIIDYHPSERMHDFKELESVPTIIINSHMTSWSENQRGHIIYLRRPFHVNDLYEAVKKALLTIVLTM